MHVLGTVCGNESNLSAEAAEEIPAEEIHEGANLTFSDSQAAFYVGVPSALKIHDHLFYNKRLHRQGPIVQDR